MQTFWLYLTTRHPLHIFFTLERTFMILLLQSTTIDKTYSLLLQEKDSVGIQNSLTTHPSLVQRKDLIDIDIMQHQRFPYDHYLPHLKKKPHRQRKPTHSLSTLQPTPTLRKRKVLSIANLEPHNLESPPRNSKQSHRERVRTLQSCRQEELGAGSKVQDCVVLMRGVLQQFQANKPTFEHREFRQRAKRSEKSEKESSLDFRAINKSKQQIGRTVSMEEREFETNRKSTIESRGSQKKTVDYYIRSHAKVNSGKPLFLKKGNSNSILHLVPKPMDHHPNYQNKLYPSENTKSLSLHPSKFHFQHKVVTERRQSCRDIEIIQLQQIKISPQQQLLVNRQTETKNVVGPTELVGQDQLDCRVEEMGAMPLSPIRQVNQSSFLSGSGRNDLMLGMWGEGVKKTVKLSSKKMKLAFPSGFFQGRH